MMNAKNGQERTICLKSGSMLLCLFEYKEQRAPDPGIWELLEPLDRETTKSLSLPWNPEMKCQSARGLQLNAVNGPDRTERGFSMDGGI